MAMLSDTAQNLFERFPQTLARNARSNLWISKMPTHIPIYWAPMRGRQVLNFNTSDIAADSVVHIAVSEFRATNRPVFQTESLPRFVGDASIKVYNVSPHESGVGFVVDVDWHEPLRFVTDITVFDEKPGEIQYMPNSHG